MIHLSTRSTCDACGGLAQFETRRGDFLCARCAASFPEFDLNPVSIPVNPGNAPAASSFAPSPRGVAAGATNPVAKATEGKAGTAVVTGHVRRSTTGTGLRVGVADAVRPATSEVMDVTAGETAPNSSEAECSRSSSDAAVTDPKLIGRASSKPTAAAPLQPSLAFDGRNLKPTLSASSLPQTPMPSAPASGCIDSPPAPFQQEISESGVGPDAANPRQSHLRGVTGGESAATNSELAGAPHRALLTRSLGTRGKKDQASNSGGALGNLEPGSATWGGDTVATAPSGRARNRAISPAAAGMLSPDPTPVSPIPCGPSVTGAAARPPLAAAPFSSLDPGHAGFDLDIEFAISALEAEWKRHGLRLGKIPAPPKYARMFRVAEAIAMASTVSSKSANRGS